MSELKAALLAGKLNVKITDEDSKELVEKLIRSLEATLNDGELLTNEDVHFTLYRCSIFKKQYIYYEKEICGDIDLHANEKPKPFTKVVSLEEYLQQVNEEEAIKKAEDALKESKKQIKKDLCKPKTVIDPAKIELIKKEGGFIYDPEEDSKKDLKKVMKELNLDLGCKIKDIDQKTYIIIPGIEVLMFVTQPCGSGRFFYLKSLFMNVHEIEDELMSIDDQILEMKEHFMKSYAEAIERKIQLKEMKEGIRK